MVFFRIRLRQVVVHAVAVQVPASLAEIVRSKLYPVLAGVYIAEVAEAQLMKIRVFFIGTNILTFAKFKEWDPEMGSSNGEKYPLAKTFTLG